MTEKLPELTDSHDDFIIANKMAIKAILDFNKKLAKVRNYYALLLALKPLRNKSKTLKMIYKHLKTNNFYD